MKSKLLTVVLGLVLIGTMFTSVLMTASAETMTIQPHSTNDTYLYITNSTNWSTAREASSADGYHNFADGHIDLCVNTSSVMISRAFLYFDTSDIPDNALITSAKLRLYAQNTIQSFDMYIYVDPELNPPHKPPVTSDWNYSYYSHLASDKLDLWGLSAPAWNNFLLTQNLTLINKTGWTALIIRSDYDVENNTPDDISNTFEFDNDYYYNHEPQLIIDYAVPPEISNPSPTGDILAERNGTQLSFTTNAECNISVYWSVDNVSWNLLMNETNADAGEYNVWLNELLYPDTIYYWHVNASNIADYDSEYYSFNVTGYNFSVHPITFDGTGTLHYVYGNSNSNFLSARNDTSHNGDSTAKFCGINYSSGNYKFYRIRISFTNSSAPNNFSIYSGKMCMGPAHIYSYADTPMNWTYMVQSGSLSDAECYSPTYHWSYAKQISAWDDNTGYWIYLNDKGANNITISTNYNFYVRTNTDIDMINNNKNEFGNVQVSSYPQYNQLLLYINYLPSVQLISPLNNSYHNDLQPNCIVNVTDPENDTVTVKFYENTTGSWVLQKTVTVNNASATWQYSNATNYNTTYYWKVVVDDSFGNRSYIYHFTTRQLPNKPSNPSPPDNAVNYTVTPSFSVYCSDPENDSMNVKFYWQNHTLIGETDISGNGTATIHPGTKLPYSTTYYWYANVTTFEGTTQSDTWNFTTRPDVPPLAPRNIRPYNRSRNSDPTSEIILEGYIPIDPDGDPLQVWFDDDTNNVTLLSYAGNAGEMLNVTLTPWYLNWSNQLNWSIHIYDGYKWTNASYWFITNEKPNSLLVFLDNNMKELVVLIISLVLWLFFIYMVVMGRYRSEIENLLFGLMILGTGLVMSGSTLLISLTIVGGLVSSVIFMMSLYFALKYSLLMFKK